MISGSHGSKRASHPAQLILHQQRDRQNPWKFSIGHGSLLGSLNTQSIFEILFQGLAGADSRLAANLAVRHRMTPLFPLNGIPHIKVFRVARRL